MSASIPPTFCISNGIANAPRIMMRKSVFPVFGWNDLIKVLFLDRRRDGNDAVFFGDLPYLRKHTVNLSLIPSCEFGSSRIARRRVEEFKLFFSLKGFPCVFKPADLCRWNNQRRSNSYLVRGP